jgi:hypothetical protein
MNMVMLHWKLLNLHIKFERIFFQHPCKQWKVPRMSKPLFYGGFIYFEHQVYWILCRQGTSTATLWRFSKNATVTMAMLPMNFERVKCGVSSAGTRIGCRGRADVLAWPIPQRIEGRWQL